MCIYRFCTKSKKMFSSRAMLDKHVQLRHSMEPQSHDTLMVRCISINSFFHLRLYIWQNLHLCTTVELHRAVQFACYINATIHGSFKGALLLRTETQGPRNHKSLPINDSRKAEMKLTAHRSRTQVSEPAANSEQL